MFILAEEKGEGTPPIKPPFSNEKTKKNMRQTTLVRVSFLAVSI